MACPEKLDKYSGRYDRPECQNCDLLKDQRRRFLDAVAHELRTPLTIVMGWLQMLDDFECFGDVKTEIATIRAAGCDREMRTILIAMQVLSASVNAGALRLLDLVDKVLDYEKTESGVLRIQMEVVDLQSLSSQAEGAVVWQVAEKRVDLQVSGSLEGVLVKTDYNRLRQVLVNLLLNALQATPIGGRVQLHLQTTSERVLFSVTDSGAGIPPERQQQIFEPLFRVESDGVAGDTLLSGLGLALASRLVQLLGSQLIFETAAGSGTKFYFVLPRVAAEE